MIVIKSSWWHILVRPIARQRHNITHMKKNTSQLFRLFHRLVLPFGCLFILVVDCLNYYFLMELDCMI
jgi:hypothetical protein